MALFGIGGASFRSFSMEHRACSLPEEEDGGFGEGPPQVNVPDLGPPVPSRFPEEDFLHLTSRAWEAQFVRRAGELVTREKIQHEIWGNETLVDFDLGINSCVPQIRAALDDDAEHPRFVETVPKQGYTFIAELTDQARTATMQTAQPGRRRLAAPTRSFLLLGAGAAVAVVIVVAALKSYPIAPVAEESESPPRVALTRRITDMPGEKAYPSLSPDGEWIAFAGLLSGNWDIYPQDVEGRNPKSLTGDFSGVDDQPAFSPDGSHIAFRSERDGGGIWTDACAFR